MSDNNVNDSGFFASLFYIAFILYFIVIYQYDNDTPTTTHTMNYIFWLIIVLCEFFWGALSFRSDIPLTNAFIDSGIAVFTTWIVLFLPTFTINESKVSHQFGLNFAEELNSIFSNVIGYYWVSREANVILSKLNAININKDGSTMSDQARTAKILYSEIMSNKTLLINQLTPSNFQCQWDGLYEYLFMEALNIQNKNSPEITSIKDGLRNIVLRKYSIGKAFWYFYTAVISFSLSIYLLSIL